MLFFKPLYDVTIYFVRIKIQSYIITNIGVIISLLYHPKSMHKNPSGETIFWSDNFSIIIHFYISFP